MARLSVSRGKLSSFTMLFRLSVSSLVSLSVYFPIRFTQLSRMLFTFSVFIG
jgi:hypothetical protein